MPTTQQPLEAAKHTKSKLQERDEARVVDMQKAIDELFDELTPKLVKVDNPGDDNEVVNLIETLRGYLRDLYPVHEYGPERHLPLYRVTAMVRFAKEAAEVLDAMDREKEVRQAAADANTAVEQLKAEYAARLRPVEATLAEARARVRLVVDGPELLRQAKVAARELFTPDNHDNGLPKLRGLPKLGAKGVVEQAEPTPIPNPIRVAGSE